MDSLGNYVVLCLEGPWDCDCGPAFWMFLARDLVSLSRFTNATGPCLRARVLTIPKPKKNKKKTARQAPDWSF